MPEDRARERSGKPEGDTFATTAKTGPLYPQLKARPGADRKAVRANQRERLHGAMIEAVVARGYTATTVADVIALAGVSRKTFYREFANKDECFLAVYDRVVQQGMERIQVAYRAGKDGERDWNAGLCRAFEAFIAEIAERPKPTRFALLNVLAVGPAARERVERAEATFATMIAQGFSQAPEEVAMPRLLLLSLVGGIWFVTRSRLMPGRPTGIEGSGQELFEWMLTYRDPVAEALPRRVPVPPPARPGRARRAEDERTRLLRAVAELAADGALPNLVPSQIAHRAGVDDDAFAEHFSTVGDCFFASLELMSAEAMARALRESEGAPDWPQALCRSVRALLCQIAEDPVFASAAFEAVYAVGPSGTRRRAGLMRSFANVLARRAPEGARPSPLIAEAIVGSVWSIAHRYVVHDRASVLPSLWPHASYLALAPIVGAEAAAQAIRAELGDEERGGGGPEGGRPPVSAASLTDM
jgi:AcrR family transcriptional regulator